MYVYFSPYLLDASSKKAVVYFLRTLLFFQVSSITVFSAPFGRPLFLILGGNWIPVSSANVQRVDVRGRRQLAKSCFGSTKVTRHLLCSSCDIIMDNTLSSCSTKHNMQVHSVLQNELLQSGVQS